MTAAQLIVLRHGRTAWNATGRFQGQADIELDERGLAQAERAAEVLAELAPVAIHSSDLSRARQTAAPLAARCGLEVQTDQRLREINVGTWEGLHLRPRCSASSTTTCVGPTWPVRTSAGRRPARPWPRWPSGLPRRWTRSVGTPPTGRPWSW